MRLRPWRFLINVGIVLAALFVGLVGLEIGTRILKPQTVFATTVNMYDRVMGTRQRPNAKCFARSRDYQMDLVINSKGLRDREFPYAKPTGTRRILCLGGSFTVGYGVQAEEAYPKVLERLLNSDAHETPTWEVLNAGVGSTGTAHQLAFYEYEGYKYGSDYVLLSFSPGTDFWDNMVSGLYSLEDGKIVKHDAPRTEARTIQTVTRWIPWYNWLSGKSHFLSFVKMRVSSWHYRQLAADKGLPDWKAGAGAEAYRRTKDLTYALLLRLRDACAARGSLLVLTANPPSGGSEWGPEAEELIDLAARAGIPFADVSPEFREGDRTGVRMSFGPDKHWTAYGHELAGQGLYRYFTENFEPEILPTSAVADRLD